tara:strand:+ start:352 stop:795 length:444 start_codon:yes stop_codon:yes gene_type:complete
MITKLKNLFTNAAQNTGSFVNTAINYSEGEEKPRLPNPADVELDLPTSKTKSKGVKGFLNKLFAKDKEGYGNARIAYKNYLDTLNSLKTGYQRFSGAKVSTGMMSPRMAGRVQSIGRATTFEDKLGEWNSRMRKFAVARYYASLGKK